MTEHRCDPQYSPEGGFGVLTEARVLALVVASLADDWAAAAVVVNEVAGCDRCTVTLIFALAAGSAHMFQTHVPDAQMQLEMQLAAVRAAAGEAG